MQGKYLHRPDKPIVPPRREASRNIMDMVREAVAGGASMEVIEKLIGLHERFEAAQARRAFDASIAMAKAGIGVVKKTRKGPNGMYEDMGAIADEIGSALAKHGLSYRYRTEQSDKIKVVCVIAHKDGHSEETALSASADRSGSKNDIQAIGSTVTYLQRYTLKAALGLAVAADDDAQSASQEQAKISEAQLGELLALADDVQANKAAFCNWAGIESFADILASQFNKAKQALEARRGSTLLRARSSSNA
jgi:ERF superfamily